MKFISFDPTLVGGQILNNISPKEIKQYKNYICAQSQTKKDQNLLDSSSLFSPLKSSILSLSKQYLDNLDHVYEDIQISNSWSVVLNKGETIPVHSHSNSYISGVFYLNYGVDIQFHFPSTPQWSFLPSHKKHPFYSISPLPSLLVLFPSFLSHSTPASSEDGRISIAFNIIPKGEFGFDTAKLYIK